MKFDLTNIEIRIYACPLNTLSCIFLCPLWLKKERGNRKFNGIRSPIRQTQGDN